MARTGIYVSAGGYQTNFFKDVPLIIFFKTGFTRLSGYLLHDFPEENHEIQFAFGERKLLFYTILSKLTLDFYTGWAKVNQKSNFFFQPIKVIDQLNFMLLIQALN